MRAVARVEVGARGPRSELVDVRSEPPLAVRRAGGRVLIVGSAAGPVGGDQLELDVTVGPGARLDLGTAAATVVWPGRCRAPSATTTTVRVAAAGHVTWRPEPLISVRGSRHRATTAVDLAAGATCTVVEEVVLGRHGEDCGELDLALRVDRDGQPLVHHAEALGPQRLTSLVAMAGARHVIALVVVGPAAGEPTTAVVADRAAAWLPLAPDAALALAVGSDRIAARAALAVLDRWSDRLTTC